MAYETINPHNGKRVKQFAEHTDAEVEKIVAQALTCFATWRRKTFAERAAVLSKAASILRSRGTEYANLITLEKGKLIAERRGEVALSAGIIDYYAEHGEGFLAPRALGHRALELPVLPARALRRPESDGR